MGIVYLSEVDEKSCISECRSAGHLSRFPPSLVIQLLVRHLLRLGLLPGQEAHHPLIRIPAHPQRGADSGLAVGEHAVTADVLDLLVVRAEDVVLSLAPLLQGVEDDALPLIVQLPGRLLHDGKLGVEGGEGGVAEGIDLLDVGRYVFVWFGEVGEERLPQLLVTGRGEIEGLGAVRVGFEGGDAIADDGVGDQVLFGH